MVTCCGMHMVFPAGMNVPSEKLKGFIALRFIVTKKERSVVIDIEKQFGNPRSS